MIAGSERTYHNCANAIYVRSYNIQLKTICDLEHVLG